MSQKTIEVQDIEVEHAEDESRNRSRTRNSWAEPSERGSEQGRRKSVKLMGQENIMDKLLEWRVKWGQHGIRFFGFIAFNECDRFSNCRCAARLLRVSEFVLVGYK